MTKLRPLRESEVRTVQFKHDIGDTVKVRDIGMAGRVDALSLDSNGELYRVVYWNDGNRNQVWMYDWELEPASRPNGGAK